MSHDARLRTFAVGGWTFPVHSGRVHAAPPERWMNKFRFMPGFAFRLPDDEANHAPYVAGLNAALARAELRIDLDADAAADRFTRWPAGTGGDQYDT